LRSLLFAAAFISGVGTYRFASAEDPEVLCYQRGVGDMEAFGEIFGLGGNYGRTKTRKDGITTPNSPRPVHPFGNADGRFLIDIHNREHFGVFMEAQRNLRFYSQLGHAGFSYAMRTGELPPMADIVLEKPGRGSILTYGPGTEVVDTPYCGNIAEPVVLIGSERKLWGVTPDFPEGQFPEGEQSVSILCKGHPAQRLRTDMEYSNYSASDGFKVSKLGKRAVPLVGAAIATLAFADAVQAGDAYRIASSGTDIISPVPISPFQVMENFNEELADKHDIGVAVWTTPIRTLADLGEGVGWLGAQGAEVAFGWSAPAGAWKDPSVWSPWR